MHVQYTTVLQHILYDAGTWKYTRKQSSFFLLDPLSKYCPHVSSSTQQRRNRKRCSGGSRGDGISSAKSASASGQSPLLVKWSYRLCLGLLSVCVCPLVHVAFFLTFLTTTK